MAYGEQNAQVFVDLEGLLEKLAYGTVDISFEVHNKRITASTYYGKKRLKYNKDNQKAMQDIADRLIKSVSEKKTEQIVFVVNMRNGQVDQTVWQSSMKRTHESQKA